MKSGLPSTESLVSQRTQSSRLPQVPRSDTFVEFAREEIEQSIPARFEKQADRYPDQIAVKTKDQTLTYSELNRLANRIVLCTHFCTEDSQLKSPLLFFWKTVFRRSSLS